MQFDKREKLQSVRISKKLFNDIVILNKLQALNGNNYTISDTINILLMQAKKEIDKLKKNPELF